MATFLASCTGTFGVGRCDRRELSPTSRLSNLIQIVMFSVKMVSDDGEGDFIDDHDENDDVDSNSMVMISWQYWAKMLPLLPLL